MFVNFHETSASILCYFDSYHFMLCRCEAALGEFLRGIKRNPTNVNFANMVNILVVHSQSEGKFW